MAAARRSAARVAAGLLALGGALALAAALTLGPAPVGAAPASTPVGCDAAARAAGGVGVAVSFPGRSLFTACVTAGGSGIDVLRRAGLSPVVQGYGSVGGGAVCALTDPRSGDQVGCAQGPSCLVCQEPRSWSYYQGYRYSSVGAGGTHPAAGAVEAWQWGSSTSWAGERAYDMCAPAPSPTTAPPATPTPTTAPSSGGAGPAAPRPDGSSGEVPGGSGAGDPGAGADPAPTTAPDGATTTRPPASSSSTTAPSSSSTTSTTSTTTEAGPAGPRPDGDREGPDAADGEGDQRAQGAPDGSMSVTEDDGGSGALVPVAGTAGVVGLLSIVAVRARRRRAGEAPAA